MKVLTANRLGDGVVVYLAADGSWSHQLADAARLEDDSAAGALAAANAAPHQLVGAYLLEADVAGPIGRDRLRELIRASGPTAGSLHRESA